MSNGDFIGSEIAGPSNPALRDSGELGNESSASATQRTQSISGTSSNIAPNSVDRTDTPGEDERFLLLKELESVIESFRGRKISQTDAVSNVLGILGKDTFVAHSKSQKEATFSSYLTEILSIQSTFDRLGGNEETDEMPASLESGAKKRASRQEDGNESDSGEDDDKSHKKPKLIDSEMPWNSAPEQPDSGISDPSCQETCRLLRAFNRDIAKAKFSIRLAPKSPSRIPSSQWE